MDRLWGPAGESLLPRESGGGRSVAGRLPQSLPIMELASRESEARGPVAVRETVCKTILNRGGISDYSLNCYTGCAHGCAYCYARYMQRFHPHAEPWGRFVDVKINAVEVLKRQLRRAAPGDVFVSSACDAWQPVEVRYGEGFEAHLLDDAIKGA